MQALQARHQHTAALTAELSHKLARASGRRVPRRAPQLLAKGRGHQAGILRADRRRGAEADHPIDDAVLLEQLTAELQHLRKVSGW